MNTQIISLENTEKTLKKPGEYCVAFDFVANEKKVSKKIIKRDKVSVSILKLLFIVTPIVFAVFFFLAYYFNWSKVNIFKLGWEDWKSIIGFVLEKYISPLLKS